MDKVNIILEGRFKGSLIFIDKNYLKIGSQKLSKDIVSSYTVIDESNKDQYSFWKGALGVALFGGIGAIAGVKGKQKKEYLIAIEWKYNGLYNDSKSLILVDDNYYKVFVRSMF